MRKLVPALILAVTLVGVASPALAGGKEPVVSCGGLSLPKVDLPKLSIPDVCSVKLIVGDLAAKVGLSAKATLDGAVALTLSLVDVGVNVTLPQVLGVLLSLPPLIAKLLCL